MPIVEPNGDEARVYAAMERLRKRVEEGDGMLANLEATVKHLDDALVVQAHLEKRMGDRIREHAEYVAFHELKMREFDDKLNALIDIVVRREGGPEAVVT